MKNKNNILINKKLDLSKKVLAACPELVYVGEKCLRQISIDANLKEGIEVSKKLRSVLLRYRNITKTGRGIAAPQIGVNKKVFVTYIGDEFQIYINPKILKSSKEKNYYRETCMSSNLLRADVKRSKKIKMSWIDIYGKKQEKEFDSFEARLLQHEYSHLEGLVNLDLAEIGSIDYLTSDPLQEKLRNKKDE